MTRAQAVGVSAIFFLLTAVLDMWGDTNMRSRLALLASLKEDKTFRIDSYKAWTIDWAHPPDGHYYSNKAPGPVFLALPLYWLIDHWLTRGISDRTERDTLRLDRSELVAHLLSLFLQVIPLIGLFFWALKILERIHLSQAAYIFFFLAYFLGSTTTLMLTTFFGHGLAAVFAMALVLALLDRRWHLAGIFFGWGVLSDYGSALFLPASAIHIWRQSSPKRWRAFLLFLAGGIVPGLLWWVYHQTSFGGGFVLPNRYQNPRFVEAVTEGTLWGIFASYPRPWALLQLLFGPLRGLLFTQPWLFITLVLAPTFLKSDGIIRQICLLVVPSLVLLLLLNASFLNWHGGGTPGPRYLCAIFPAFAFLGAYLFDHIPQTRWIMVLTLFLTLTFNSLVFASHRLQNPEQGSVWTFFFQTVFLTDTTMPKVRFFLFWTLTMGMVWWAHSRRPQGAP